MPNVSGYLYWNEQWVWTKSNRAEFRTVKGNDISGGASYKWSIISDAFRA